MTKFKALSALNRFLGRIRKKNPEKLADQRSRGWSRIFRARSKSTQVASTCPDNADSTPIERRSIGLFRRLSSFFKKPKSVTKPEIHEEDELCESYIGSTDHDILAEPSVDHFSLDDSMSIHVGHYKPRPSLIYNDSISESDVADITYSSLESFETFLQQEKKEKQRSRRTISQGYLRKVSAVPEVRNHGFSNVNVQQESNNKLLIISASAEPVEVVPKITCSCISNEQDKTWLWITAVSIVFVLLLLM